MGAELSNTKFPFPSRRNFGSISAMGSAGLPSLPNTSFMEFCVTVRFAPLELTGRYGSWQESAVYLYHR